MGGVGEDVVAADDGREDEDGFLGGESGADANAGTCTEGDECFASGLFAFVGFEAFGVEDVGIFPDGAVSVEEPGGDEDGASFADGFIADLVGFRGFADEESDGRVEAKGFAEDVPCFFQAMGIAVLEGTLADLALDFGAERLDGFGGVGEEV